MDIQRVKGLHGFQIFKRSIFFFFLKYNILEIFC